LTEEIRTRHKSIGQLLEPSIKKLRYHKFGVVDSHGIIITTPEKQRILVDVMMVVQVVPIQYSYVNEI
jgi:hypothetical protein